MFGNLLALCTPGLETLSSRFIPLVCDSPGDGHRGGNARHSIKPVCPQLLLSFGQGLDHRFSLLSPLHGVPPILAAALTISCSPALRSSTIPSGQSVPSEWSPASSARISARLGSSSSCWRHQASWRT